MRELARTGSFDDVGLMTWPAAKLLFGATTGSREPTTSRSPHLRRHHRSVGAELEARIALGRSILDDAAIDSVFEVEHLVKMLPGMAKLAELPTTLDFLLELPRRRAGVGGFVRPGRGWVAGAEAGMEILEDHGSHRSSSLARWKAAITT